MHPPGQSVLPTRPSRPEITAGQRVAGKILRVFGYVAIALGGAFWIGIVLSTGMGVTAQGVQALPPLGMGLLVALLFFLMGRIMHQFGFLIGGREGALGGRLFAKRLVRDLVFEVAGLLVIPLALTGVVFLLRGELLGLAFLFAALLSGYGFPRLMHSAIRRM